MQFKISADKQLRRESPPLLKKGSLSPPRPPLPYPPKTFIRVDGGTGGTGSRPSTGRLPASQQKASPEPLWFGAFLSLATAYGCFISTLERGYDLFLQFPVGRSYIETFHPLSLETCNGSIIVKARCSFYAIQNKCRRAFFATEIFGNYLKKRNEDNGSKITPIQCHDRAASINKALGRVVNYI